MTARRVRSVVPMSNGLADRDVARAIRQLEDRVGESVGHGHDAFGRATAGFAPAPGAGGHGRVLHEDGVWRTSPVRNGNAADVVANGADTYLADSVLAVPAGVTLRAGVVLRWRFGVSKTAAGVAVPAWSIRCGAAGGLGDAAIGVINGRTAQTAAASLADVVIEARLRAAGAAAVLAAVSTLVQSTGAAGFATVAAYATIATGAAFDATASGLRFGISVNPGAAGVWTHTLIDAELALA